MRQVSLPAQPPVGGPLFFPVAIRKLVVMSLFTLNCYQCFWFYKQWKIVQARTGARISPFWRAVFSLYWAHALFEMIEGSAVGEGVELRLNSTWATWVWWGFFACGDLPRPFSYLMLLSVAPLTLIQLTCNELNQRITPQHAANSRFSALNVVGILVGGGLLIRAIIRACR